jgi:hypothetical protein
MANKKKPPKKKTLPPRPLEVEVIATIRWYANAIENWAIQAYLGDRDKKDSLIGILSNARHAMEALATAADPSIDCPWPVDALGCHPPLSSE